MTAEEARAFHAAWLEKLEQPPPEALAFEATYAHHMPLPKPGETVAQDVLAAARSMPTSRGRGRAWRDSLRRTVVEWAEANGLVEEADYGFHANWVGFKSPDAAFWYKVAML